MSFSFWPEANFFAAPAGNRNDRQFNVDVSADEQDVGP